MMKSNLLFRIFTLMWVLGISVSQVCAQQQKTMQNNTAYPYTLSSFYIGAQGGHLFKNNELAENPAFFLDQGYFAELNLGWRANKNWFGWQLNAGRLNLERQLPYTGESVIGLNGYDILQSGNPNWMWSKTERDGRKFLFNQETADTSGATDFGSWYAMTGPQFWLGKGRLQGFLSLNAGVGMTRFGYYFMQGKETSSNTLRYDYYSQANDQVAGAVDTRLQGNYLQYGMSRDAFTRSGSPTSFIHADIKDEATISLMARGALGLEYFISPRFSINASASYWYIMVPDWSSGVQSSGGLFFNGEWDKGFKPVKPGVDPFLNDANATIKGAADYSYTRDFEEKNLGLISASIGLKFWIGKKHTPKRIVKEKETPSLVVPQIQKKDLLITVKDKPTGYALSSVKVTVYKDGKSFYTGMTDVNGAVPVIKDVWAGNYTIRGVLNGIETTVADLDSADFAGAAQVINRELLHNDLRFTLLGHTLNAQTEARIAHVKTTLNQDKGGENSFQMSDDQGEFRFQLKPDADFTVYAEQKGYFSNRAQVTTKGLDRSKTLYVDLRLAMNELKKGAHFELKNIYYDFDQSDIRPDAAPVLDDVYRMLVDNPTVTIELSSYTDSRGSDAYNMKLSQERAASAVQYLVKKGIDPSRLVAKGYGETRPVNGCINGEPCTEEQHQANRRTEIKVLKE